MNLSKRKAYVQNTNERLQNTKWKTEDVLIRFMYNLKLAIFGFKNQEYFASAREKVVSPKITNDV
jgi:hypothetical protein